MFIKNIIVTTKNKVYFSTVNKGVYQFNQKYNIYSSCNYNILDATNSKILKLDNDDVYCLFYKENPKNNYYNLFKLIDSNWVEVKNTGFNEPFTTDGKRFFLSTLDNIVSIYDPVLDTLQRHFFRTQIMTTSKSYDLVIYGIEGSYKLSEYGIYRSNLGFFIKSTDVGFTWRRILNGCGSVNAIDLVAIDSLKLVIASEKGVYFSNNSGEKWINISDTNVNKLLLTSILVFNDTILCGSFENGIYKSVLQKHDLLIPYQWSNKNGYKEFKASETEIKLLEFNISKNEIIINNDFTITFFEFNNLNRKKIIHRRGIDTTWCINLNLTLSKDQKYLGEYAEHSNIINVFDMENDNCQRSSSFFKIDNYLGGMHTEFFNFSATLNNEIIFVEAGFCQWKFTDYGGQFVNMNLLTGAINYSFPIMYFTKVIKSDNGNYYIFKYGDQLKLYNSTFQFISSLQNSVNDREICISTDNNYCAVCDFNNKITIFSLPDWKIKYIFEYTKSNYITSMAFNSLNRLVTIASDGEIKYWKIYNPLPFDALWIDNNNVPQKIKLMSDNEVLTYGSDGFVRYIKNPFLTSVDVSEYDNNTFTISPNPASDFIEIFVGANGRSPLQSEVRIYNVLGEIQATPNPTPNLPASREGVRIYISSLPPGLYFVRIGETVQKFIKL